MTLLTCPVMIAPQAEIAVPTAKTRPTTPLPVAACNVNMTVADCSHRGLSEVPTTLPATITVLLMDHNDMKNLISKQFARFENLTYLDISHNYIYRVKDDSFDGLTRLRCLHMESNSVHCPDKAFSVLYSLEELSLDGSPNMTFGEHFQNLTKLTSLSLSGHEGRCHLVNIFNNTFNYVPHLTFVNLTKCQLQCVHAGAFVPLRNIEELDISDNQHLQFGNFRNVTYGLMNSSIQILHANAIVKRWSVCNIMDEEYVQYLKNTGLHKLYFDYNRVEVFGKATLFQLPETLWFISVRYNLFTFGPYVFDLKHLKNVTHIYLGQDCPSLQPHGSYERDNNVLEMSVFCDSHSDNICPVHNKYYSKYNTERFTIPSPPVYKKIYTVIVPPNMQVVALPCERVSAVIGWTRITSNNISALDLSFNLFSQWIGPVEGLEKLEILDLSHNTAQYVSRHFFPSAPRVKVLNISSNSIGLMMRSGNETCILDNLTSLEVLDMSFNGIHILPEYIFHDLVSAKTVNLSYNSLYLDLPLRVNNMKNLETLDISNNQIRWFSDVLIQDLDTLAQSRNVSIHMIFNTISCTCSNLGFLNWMKSSRIIFVDVHNYTCAFANKTFSPMGKFEDVVNKLQKECSTHLGLVLISIFSVVIVLLIISGGMAYRYRWNLRYWYYAAKLKLKNEQLLANEEQEPFIFSAFVSHADEDEHFVLNELRRCLETEDSGIQLNIHHRDFVPGQEIAANILSAIQGSKKTVVVLSSHFLRSYWCMYELQLANMESIKTGRDVLIIIMYEDISTREIPKEVLYHLKTDSYISYPNTGDAKQIDLFWQRLTAVLART